jgi:O-antigen ligase
MSLSYSPAGMLSRRPAFGTHARGAVFSSRRVSGLTALWLGVLVCVLVAQGIAISQSYLLAAPLLCLLMVLVVPDVPLAPLIGVLLLARILTDDLSETQSRHSAALNTSGLIAGFLILTAVGMLIRHRRGAPQIALMTIWLAIWTAIAVSTDGASTLSIREGVRETSILAVAVIVYNAPRVFSTSSIIRIVQVAGLASALIAIYQLATHTGQRVGAGIHGEIRSNGTFAHPNAAALYFAVATIASLWRYTGDGHRRSDAAFCGIYAAAALATFSLGGLASLLVMLLVFGTVNSGRPALKFGPWLVGALLIVALMATPIGAERLANESETNISTTHVRNGANTSLAWRLYKWQTLIPEWEKAPLFGRGLGTTTTTEDTLVNTTVGNLPHNEYVRYLVETGAVGLLILLAGVATLIRRLARLRTRGSEAGWSLGLAIVVGLLVNGLAANTLLYTPAAYAAAGILAALLSIPKPVDMPLRPTPRIRLRPSHA